MTYIQNPAIPIIAVIATALVCYAAFQPPGKRTSGTLSLIWRAFIYVAWYAPVLTILLVVATSVTVRDWWKSR